MDLSELIDELREISIYETDPQDWMGYLEEDSYPYNSNLDLIY